MAEILLSQPYNFDDGPEGAVDSRRFYNKVVGFGYVQAIDTCYELPDEAWLATFFADDEWFRGDSKSGTMKEMQEFIKDDKRIAEFIYAAIANDPMIDFLP